MPWAGPPTDPSPWAKTGEVSPHRPARARSTLRKWPMRRRIPSPDGPNLPIFDDWIGAGRYAIFNFSAIPTTFFSKKPAFNFFEPIVSWLAATRSLGSGARSTTILKDDDMASFRGHLVTAAGLGVIYGGAAYWRLSIDPILAAIAAGITAVGGLLPDLDSDSSVPNRILFRLAAVGAVILTFQYLLTTYYSIVEGAVILAGAYLAVRYVLATVFRFITVHCGMFHSIPSMLIVGLSLYLLYENYAERDRLFMAGAGMFGFL